MKLQLNGTQIDTSARKLSDLLVAQGFGDAKVATAVNGEFVPATARDACLLSQGDLIEVLAPMQGG